MRRSEMGRMLQIAACLAGASLVGNGLAARGNEAAAIKTSERRASEFDLEITGDLPGFRAKTVRYISRAELLKLPQKTFTVSDDANFSGKTEVSGVPLSELARAIAGPPADQMIVAICVDQYHAHYTAEYVHSHQPILALKVNGQDPPEWPRNAEVRDAPMGPYLISHEKFTPSFTVLAHQDEPQIPWGVVRLEFRDEKSVLAAIAPRGPHAADTSVQNGFLIAQQNCFRCHDHGEEGGRKSGRSWPVLAAWAEAGPQRFAAYVRNPQAVNAKSQMAASPQYDDATMQALMDYFKTFLAESKK